MAENESHVYEFLSLSRYDHQSTNIFVIMRIKYRFVHRYGNRFDNNQRLSYLIQNAILVKWWDVVYYKKCLSFVVYHLPLKDRLIQWMDRDYWFDSLYVKTVYSVIDQSLSESTRLVQIEESRFQRDLTIDFLGNLWTTGIL